MKVGIDTFSIRDLKLDIFQMLDWIKDHGFAGGLFSVQGTDEEKLQEFYARAGELEIYADISVSSPNPYTNPEKPKSIRETVDSIVAEIKTAGKIGFRELHSTLGGPGNRYSKLIPWDKQLYVTEQIFHRLRPVLRDFGCRIDLETHGDTTTFELVELTEKVGPDICGICLDTANVFIFGEHPIEAAKRAAPYTHLTHIKDAFIFFDEKGVKRQTIPPGRGSIDWKELLSILYEYNPDLNLSIEDHKWIFGAEIFEQEWNNEQRRLSRKELAMTMKMAWLEQKRIFDGERQDPYEYEKTPHVEELEERLIFGRDYLNRIIQENNLI